MVQPRDGHSRNRRLRPGAARAVTLVEMVVAMALTTVVVGAAASVMFVASRALPSAGDGSVVATDAAMGLAMFEAEAQTATDIGTRGDGFVLRIPDRTGDLVPEVVQYRWGGNAGDPLTRTDASGTNTIVDAVVDALLPEGMPRGLTKTGRRIG